MDFFGLFGKKTGASPLGKHAGRVASKRVQAVDRWESIQTLIKVGTPEAVEALLPRFTFYVEPSITDEEEKDAAFAGIVGLGEVALAPVILFLQKAESISWPVKMLDKLAPADFVISKLLELLEAMDTEYERDPQRKIQILATFEERTDSRVIDAVTRFLKDANETVRFTAVGALFAQEEVARCRQELVDCLCDEESLRIRNRILQGFCDRDWEIGARKEEVINNLPAGYYLDPKGFFRRSKSN
ncbi:MAG: HEAT repeat domain-containing protein [Deltaproteobacteria bacterium]|nr:HEAT repeat domain-containing protein [Deltaproteobacteria bacterium]